MCVRKTVNPFRAVAIGDEFGFDSDQVVRNEVLRRFHFGKQPAVLLIQKTGEEKISAGLDFVAGIIRMVNLGEKHREDVIVYHILGYLFKAF